MLFDTENDSTVLPGGVELFAVLVGPLTYAAIEAIAQKAKAMPCGHSRFVEIRKQCLPRPVGQIGVVAVVVDDNAQNHFVDRWPTRREALVNFLIEVATETGNVVGRYPEKATGNL